MIRWVVEQPKVTTSIREEKADEHAQITKYQGPSYPPCGGKALTTLTTQPVPGTG